MANINDDTAPYQPTGPTDAATAWHDPVAAGGPHGAGPRHVSSGGDTRRHTTPLALALGLWVAALALGITTGALTDSPPAGEDAQRPETVVGGPEDLQATASTTPPTTLPPTSQPTLPPTTAPPPPEDSDDSDDSEDSGDSEGSGERGDSDTRCDAAQAAADQAQAAVDGVHETLLELAEAEQAAADAETQAEQACSGGDD
jgi:type IV secretory pathway VirB10-like protein